MKPPEAFIEENFTEPLSLADIAAHAGVSARSLQNGFQNFRGMTPMAFLRSVRLRHVHRELLRADPRVVTVTEIAMRFGFCHMGEFAGLYKRAYGASAGPGQLVEVHYVGVSWSTGEQFDASWDRGDTFEFSLGEGKVIQGWDEGVAGMRVGGRRRMTIPPHLAYGKRGAGGVIGPDETLVFVVDLIGVR